MQSEDLAASEAEFAAMLGLPPLYAPRSGDGAKPEEDITVDQAFPYPEKGVDVVWVKAEEVAAAKKDELAAKLKERTGRGCPICLKLWAEHHYTDFWIDQRHIERARDFFHAKDKLLGRLEALVTKLDASDSPGALHEKERVDKLYSIFKESGAKTANEMQVLMNYNTSALRNLFNLYRAGTDSLYSLENAYDVTSREMAYDKRQYEEVEIADFSDHEQEAKAKFMQLRADAERIEGKIERFKEQVDILTKESFDQRMERVADKLMQKRTEDKERDKTTAAPQGGVSR